MERKVRELRYAIALEKRLTKDQILERYLNIAYYGEGAYGVEAAARHYFSTHAAKLNLAQAAMLAGLVQNPDANNPVRNLGAALDRRDVVLNRMAELNMISTDQVAGAKKYELRRGQGHADPQRLRRHPVPVPVRLCLSHAAERPRASATPSRSARTWSSAEGSPSRPPSIPRPRIWRRSG